ncbi:MAG: hypothetical protein HDR20_02905 [Lachnospiraceae bacterium]|nr:hypothetical protein [Lachnospiraceae bacterium]
MLSEFIKENYEPGEPIFLQDIKTDGMSDANIRQKIKKLTDEGEVIRYEQGIYYIPKMSRLKGTLTLVPDIVARYKYISRMGRIMGDYAGRTLANKMGISMQVPLKEEITTNNMAAIVREVYVGNRVYVVRRAPVEVNEGNHIVLQLFELLKDIDEYSDDEQDARQQVIDYIRRFQITRDAVDRYIGYFPLKVYKSIYEMRLGSEFAANEFAANVFA